MKDYNRQVTADSWGFNHSDVQYLEELVCQVQDSQKLQKIAMDQTYDTMHLKLHALDTEGRLDEGKGEKLKNIPYQYTYTQLTGFYKQQRIGIHLQTRSTCMILPRVTKWVSYLVAKNSWNI